VTRPETGLLTLKVWPLGMGAGPTEIQAGPLAAAALGLESAETVVASPFVAVSEVSPAVSLAVP